MNILKNFEAIFVVTLGLACAANYALDTNTDQQVASAAAAPAASSMQVVVVSAKRLSEAEKLQSLISERKASLATNAAAASTI
ncbi:MAG: hypothetical protein ACEQSK_14465 [Sphingomonadaceae bacterium]